LSPIKDRLSVRFGVAPGGGAIHSRAKCQYISWLQVLLPAESIALWRAYPGPVASVGQQVALRAQGAGLDEHVFPDAGERYFDILAARNDRPASAWSPRANRTRLHSPTVTARRPARYREFESLSLRQDALGRQSLCATIAAQKPRNPAVFRGRLFTSSWCRRLEIPL
jgi:hypothetical protein